MKYHQISPVNKGSSGFSCFTVKGFADTFIFVALLRPGSNGKCWCA